MDNVDKVKSYFPILFDGAMGTYYRESVENHLPECEMANIFDSDSIYRIHKEYLNSGADAIKTNTFGANTRALNCSKDVRDKILEYGFEIAKKAVDDFKKDSFPEFKKEALIFADIGPIAYSSQDKDDIEKTVEEYVEIVDIFLEKGAVNFLFETLDEVGVLGKIFRYIKTKKPDSFIISSFAVDPDGYTRKGFYLNTLIEEVLKEGFVDAVGLNCVSGPGYTLNNIRRLDNIDKPVSVMPNASYPSVVNSRLFYSDNPLYFAKTSIEFLDCGAEIVGGCCGTTPKHIRFLREELNRNEKEEKVEAGTEFNKIKTLNKIITKQTANRYLDKIHSDKKAIAVELDPPSDVDIEKYMKNVSRIKEAGADAITIADCPVGRARIDSSLMAYKLKNELGVEPVVHLTCRDRNLNATKAILLGLNIENIKNLILVTGDPIPNAEKNEIKPVFNFNSVLLSQYISELNEKVFTNKMTISAGLNINALNFEIEIEKALKKQAAGAEVFYTQPVLSQRAVENIIKAESKLKSRIMGGILPIVSYRNAVFMNEEISGISVDESIVEMYRNTDREEASKLAVEISMSYIKKIYNHVDGFYLITPFSRIEIIEEIIGKIEKL